MSGAAGVDPRSRAEADAEALRALIGLDGKAALVTGGTSLIALWIVRLLRLAGARVAVTDRLDEAAIRDAWRALAADAGEPSLDPGDDAVVLDRCDIRNATDDDVARTGRPLRSVDAMVGGAVDALGGLDVLVNVAGGQEPLPAAALSPELLRRTTDRILIGSWAVIHAVYTRWMRVHGGRILTVTADVDQGYPLMPGMGAARAGLSSMHRALAVEWASAGITTCVIAPGATDTPGLKRYPAAARVREVAQRAANLGRLLEPREVAWLFLAMASPLAACVNGHTLVANGGDSFVTPLFREMTAGAGWPDGGPPRD